MSIETISQQLIHAGFNKSDDHFYRLLHDYAHRCQHNNESPYLTVRFWYFDHLTSDKSVDKVEVGVVGKINGQWYRIEAYSVDREKIIQSLPDIEPRLIAAWNALAGVNTNA
jgi:hypothetical protein